MISAVFIAVLVMILTGASECSSDNAADREVGIAIFVLLFMTITILMVCYHLSS